jgi:transcriptional regulator with XRE-family HTH domain
MAGAKVAARESFGARLQRFRQAAGLTQEQLSEKAGLSVHNVRNWEHDHRQPRIEALLRLARALAVPMEDLASALVEDPPAKSRRKKDH